MTEIVTDLQQVSPEFRAWWLHRDVQAVHKGQKQLDHPLVGLLLMQVTTFQLPDHPSLRMIVDTPIPGTDTLVKLTALSASGAGLYS